jgi:hypothetical protein
MFPIVGDFVLDWSPIEIRNERHALTIWVSSDVLRLGNRWDSVRVPVTCRTHRAIAAELDALLPTPRISDLVWLHATVRLGVYVQAPRRTMASKSAFLRHHEQLERELAGRTRPRPRRLQPVLPARAAPVRARRRGNRSRASARGACVASFLSHEGALPTLFLCDRSP